MSYYVYHTSLTNECHFNRIRQLYSLVLKGITQLHIIMASENLHINLPTLADGLLQCCISPK